MEYTDATPPLMTMLSCSVTMYLTYGGVWKRWWVVGGWEGEWGGRDARKISYSRINRTCLSIWVKGLEFRV